MQECSYIKVNQNRFSESVDLAKFAYTVCQIACSVLIVYFCWYVQAFGNYAVVVNGSFLIMCGCIGIIWLYDGVIQTSSIPYGIWNQLFMVVYCLITGLFVAYDRLELIEAVRTYFIYVVFMFGICIVSAYKKSYKWILIVLNCTALICCIHLMGWGYCFPGNRYALSPNSNPNLLGTILNLGLFSVLMRTKITFKSLMISVPQVCLLLYNIIMTGSRKSLIASTMILIFWGFSSFSHVMKYGKKKQKIIIIIVLVCAAIAAYYYFTTFVANSTVMNRMQLMGDEDSTGDRVQMYEDAVKIFLDKPLFGGGLKQFMYWSGWGGYSHSTYAQSISDFGFIGSILYFAPFVMVSLRLFQLSFFKNNNFQSRFVLGFCIVEFFLAVGQIWFFEMAHFLAWTTIFLIAQDIDKPDQTDCVNKGVFKYVRN